MGAVLFKRSPDSVRFEPVAIRSSPPRRTRIRPTVLIGCGWRADLLRSVQRADLLERYRVALESVPVGQPVCENTGIEPTRRKSFFDFRKYERNSAVDAIGKRAIEKTILQLVGS